MKLGHCLYPSWPFIPNSFAKVTYTRPLSLFYPYVETLWQLITTTCPIEDDNTIVVMTPFSTLTNTKNDISLSLIPLQIM